MIFGELGSLRPFSQRVAQSWFASLDETSSPLLENFPAFLEEFEATFGDADHRRTSISYQNLLVTSR